VSASTELSQALAGAAAQAGPSVVRVEGRVRATSSGVVWSAAGHILTAEHTLQRDEGITVGLADGREVPAKLIGRDPSTDIALLSVEAGALTPLSWAEATALQVGQLALVAARPGRSVRATLGVVSALSPAGETWRAPHGGRLERYAETDVAPRWGFSGGAVLDAAGKGLGLHTTGLVRGTALALTPGTLRRVAEALLAHGGVRRGFLGVGTYPVRLPEALEKQLGQGSALLVVSVADSSPAASSGVMMGDLLVSLSGKALRHMGDLVGSLEEEAIGQELALQVIRAGQTKDLRITVGARA
jgi:S1-C subfamily serine protease